ncbi:MAG TPA: ATP-binding cassette domain-containing protein, partial [Candidatus Dormibacteraeota bacterium]|nr:ATP-binding cassette domain-containing protein [Candidatus Dormibacteraeota bacterium]
MATLVEESGEPSSAKKRRRRRRRRETEAGAAAPAPAANGAGAEPVSALSTEADSAAVTVVPEPEQEPVTVSVVPEPEPEPAVSHGVLVAAPAYEKDDFKDLLGQAVGLRLDSVSREFGGNDEMHVTALRNVSLEIGPCEFVSVVGPSGCGKTTLLSLMGGLDRPTAGHVYGAGLPLGELS